MKLRPAAVLITALALAGCATAQPAPAPVAAPPARSAVPVPAGCAHPGPAVTVTNADDGGVVCLTTGGTLTLALTGAGWKPPALDGDVLKAAGDKTFTAVSAGKTTLSSSHPACPTGTVKCQALKAFQVRIVVS
jgi:hypothetical protein